MKYAILSLLYYRISQAQNKYSFRVCTDQPDQISNMISMILSYQANTQYISYRRIRRILSAYSVSIRMGQPDGQCNILITIQSYQVDMQQIFTQHQRRISMILSDQLDTQWIFIPCIYRLARLNIQYDLDNIMASGEHIIHCAVGFIGYIVCILVEWYYSNNGLPKSSENCLSA